VRSAISAPPPFRKLHCSGQKQPNSLVEQNWSDTTAAGCVQFCRARPCTHRVAARALRSAVVESEKFGIDRRPGKRNELCGGVGMAEQPTLRFSLRCEAGRRLCFRDSTQHTLSVWSLILRFHINSVRADTTRKRDPSARNLCQTMWSCVQSRCFTVTLIADPHLRARAGSQRASLQASGTPTPPRRWK